MAAPSVLDYYTAHDPFSDPGEYSALLRTLPVDRTEQLAAINGVLLHIWKVKKYFPDFLQQRPHDVFTRHIRSVLHRIQELDDQPLDVPRPEERRAIVDCRTFSLFLCSILRERGIPARVRCGFATYLEETHYQDHWICEWWSDTEHRWIMDDPDLQKQDVSSEEFITGTQAWIQCQAHSERSALFGWGPGETGLWTVRYNLVRDLAALHGFVSVSGDSWGIAHTKRTEVLPQEKEFLDRVALLCASDEHFEERRTIFEEAAGIQAPDKVRHYDYIISYKPRYIDWRTAD